MNRQLNEIIWIDANEDPLPSSELIEEYKSKDFHPNPIELETKIEDPKMFESLMSRRDLFRMTWSEMLKRMQGAACLPKILSGELRHLIDDTEFEYDAMFCEYAYWIDFENGFMEMTCEEVGKWSFEELSNLEGFWMRLRDEKMEDERKVQEVLRSWDAAREAEKERGNGEKGSGIGVEEEHVHPPQPGADDHPSTESWELDFDYQAHSQKIQELYSLADAPKRGTPSPHMEFLKSLGIRIVGVESGTMDALIAESSQSARQPDGGA